MNLFDGRLMRHHQQKTAMHLRCGSCDKVVVAPPGYQLPVKDGKPHHPGCYVMRKEVVKS